MEFSRIIQEYRAAGQREGQATANALCVVHPELIPLIPEEVDPFYDDSILPAFWEWFTSQEVVR